MHVHVISLGVITHLGHCSITCPLQNTCQCLQSDIILIILILFAWRRQQYGYLHTGRLWLCAPTIDSNLLFKFGNCLSGYMNWIAPQYGMNSVKFLKKISICHKVPSQPTGHGSNIWILPLPVLWEALNANWCLLLKRYYKPLLSIYITFWHIVIWIVCMEKF